jgi:hypothetical protein
MGRFIPTIHFVANLIFGGWDLVYVPAFANNDHSEDRSSEAKGGGLEIHS